MERQPNRHVVMVIHEYESFGDLDSTEMQVRDSVSHYETPHFVVAADSLSNLPHPMQVPEISKHFLGE